MPTYQVTTTPGLLDAAAKGRLARAITRAHSAATGANSYFAQVMFTEKADGDYFLGGQPLRAPQLFVHGTVRARPLADKQRLLAALLAAVAEAAGLQRRHVWVYLAELAPELMIEFGHVLPAPGAEAAWVAALPADDRAYLLAIDAAHPPAA